MGVLRGQFAVRHCHGNGNGHGHSIIELTDYKHWKDRRDPIRNCPGIAGCTRIKGPGRPQ